MFESLIARINGQAPKFEHLLGGRDHCPLSDLVSPRARERAGEEIKLFLSAFSTHDKQQLMTWLRLSLEIINDDDLDRDEKIAKLRHLNPSEATVSFLRNSLSALIGYLPSEHRGIAHRATQKTTAVIGAVNAPLFAVGQIALKQGLPLFFLTEHGIEALRFLKSQLEAA